MQKIFPIFQTIYLKKSKFKQKMGHDSVNRISEPRIKRTLISQKNANQLIIIRFLFCFSNFFYFFDFF